MLDRAGEEARLRMAQARVLASIDEAIEFYRQWAETYDRDVFDLLKFTGSARIAELLAGHLEDHRTRIIDLGCGTGFVGAVLRQLGFEDIDGLDLSPDMLAIAEAKGVYTETIAADLLQPLPIASGSYGAAISAGTFTTGHVDSRALAEIFRILAPGGILACVIAQGFWDIGGFATKLARLTDARRLRILHDTLEPVREGSEPDGRFLVVQAL